MTQWQVKEAGPGVLQLEVPGYYKADVRFDGCVHFRRIFNEGADVDYLHICDLDETIALLQDIKTLALQHFDGWPE